MMAIENWIDEIARLAGTVAAGGRGNVRSYYCFSKSEFPEAITEFPAAITYVTSMRLQGASDSGPTIALWRGVTEFHICAGVSKATIPEVLPYFERILKAFVSERTLGGRVAEFSLVKDADGEAIVAGNLEYGEAGVKNRGLVAYWKVKELVTGLTLGS